MTPEIYQKAKALFEAGLSVSKSNRTNWLDTYCSDPELREAVESLLNEHDNPIGFVDGPIEQGIGDLLAADGGQTDATRKLPERIGRYKILRVVGRGGMGTVYEAQQESPRRRVALKVIRSSMLSPQLLRRFSLEAQVLGQLQHAGIAQIYEASIDERADDQVPYFAMEFIDGCSLTEFCSTNSLSLQQRLDLFARVCDAVQHAHQKGIIHRDLKPANILVVDEEVTELRSDEVTKSRREAESSVPGASEEDSKQHSTKSPTRSTPTSSLRHSVTSSLRNPITSSLSIGHPKIVDFGIARMLDSDQQAVTLETSAGELVGTLCYMSPEQVSGQTRDIDTRCDVYALGVILYELLAGSVPFSFRGLAITEAIRIVRDDEPERLGAVNPTCRGDIETIVGKAMEKDRDRRYASAAELAADLRRFMRDEPIQARPTTALYQLSKFARRNKALVGGVLATMVALVLGLAGSLYFLQQSKQRAAQLQHVADFQGRMLTEIDVEEMGRQLISDVRKDALKRAADVGDDALSNGFVEQFDRFVSRIDATGIAARLLDEQIISNAVMTVDREFGDQPMVDAELRMSLSQVYDSLGLYEKAADQSELAYDRRVSALGDDQPDTLLSLRKVGMMQAMAGDYSEAAEKVQTALDGLRRARGENDRDTIRTMMNLGNVQTDMGNYEKAEATLQAALDRSRQAFGTNDRLTIDIMGQLGVMYRITEMPDKAEPMLKDALDASRKTLGEDDLETIRLTQSLAIFYNSERRHKEAQPLLIEAYKKCGVRLGENHPETLSHGHSLAESYVLSGQYDLAEPILRDVLQRRRDVHGSEHPAVIRSLNTLSHLLMRTKRKPEAADLLEETYGLAKRVLGKSNNTTTVAAFNLASAYKELGEYERAKTYAEIAYEGRIATFGPDHYRTLLVRGELGEVLMTAGEFEEGAALFADLLTTLRETDAQKTRLYSSVLSRLAQARIAIGKSADAEPLCRELLAFCEEHLASSPAIVAWAQRLVATSLIHQQKLDDAKALLEKAIEGFSSKLPEDHWHLVYTRALLYAVQSMLGDEESVALLREAATTLKDNPETIDYDQRAWAMSQLNALTERVDH